jgi:hypothetical protein
MTLTPSRRLCLGCGEALGPLATAVLRRSPPPAQAPWPLERQIPPLPTRVLNKR